MLNKLNDILVRNNVNTEIDELEYHNGYKEGIIVYFPNGECLQVFYDNQYIVIDEELSIMEECKSEHVIAIHIINYYEDKLNKINNSDEYYRL